MAINPQIWYTAFQRANAPGAPMGSAMQAANPQMAPTQAGVFVTPNDQPAPQTVQPLPQGASPYLRSLAQTMMGTGSSVAPVQSPIEGIARSLTGALGGYFAGQANEADTARQAALGGRLANIIGLDPEQAEGLTPEQVIGVGGLMGKKEPETWRQLTPAEAQTYGVPENEVWQINDTGKLRKPGAGGTTVNLPGEARPTFTSEQAKADVKRYAGWVEAAESAGTQMSEIREAQRLLDQGLQTGVVTDLTSGLARTMTAFGLDPEDYGLQDASSVEQFRSISNRLTLDLTEKLKGALSNKELDFIRDGTIGVGQTPETNRQIMALLEKGARQASLRLDAADVWIDEYGDLRSKNEDGRTFFSEWRRWLKDNEAGLEPPESFEESTAPATAQAGVVGSETAETASPSVLSGETLTIADVKAMPRADLRKYDFNTMSDEALDAAIARLQGNE